jgi:hypothetical protein
MLEVPPKIPRRFKKNLNIDKITPSGRGGLRRDRDITACMNMLRMRGAPFPLKAAYEPTVVRLKG